MIPERMANYRPIHSPGRKPVSYWHEGLETELALGERDLRQGGGAKLLAQLRSVAAEVKTEAKDLLPLQAAMPDIQAIVKAGDLDAALAVDFVLKSHKLTKDPVGPITRE